MNYRPLDADVVYAGFWLRFVAYVLDLGFIILIALVMPVASSHGPAGPNFAAQETSFFIVLWWPYGTLMECSSLHATVGRLIMGLRVTDMHGQRVSFGRAASRNLGKLVCGLFFFVGYARAGWSDEKQARHDLMAGCLVVRKR